MNISQDRLVATGTFGDIHTGKWASIPCAIKISNFKKDSKNYILSADFFLRFLHTDSEASSFIIDRYSIVKLSNRQIGLVTELSDTNLKEHLKAHPDGFSLETTRTLTKQLTEALHFLAKKNLIYPNLKTEHILISNEKKTIKLGNLEKVYFKDGAHQFAGTSHEICLSPFSSPELLLNINPSETSSIWSLAVIVTRVFTGQVIFKLTILKEMLAAHRLILERDYPSEILRLATRKLQQVHQESLTLTPSRFKTLDQIIRDTARTKQDSIETSEQLLDLLHKMFSYNKRVSAIEVLSHPFFEPIEVPREPETTLDQTHDSITLINEPMLGKGSFGSVHRGLWKKNGIAQKFLAVKINEEDTKNNLLHEDLILRFLLQQSVDTPSIVNRLGIINISEGRIGLLLELMQGNLHNYIKQHKNGLSLEKSRSFTKQLSQALEVLFQARIIHLDIKPGNILVSSNGEIVKLTDFGSACFSDKACHPDSLYQTSRWWRDPCTILEIPFTTACDIWSLAVVLTEMFTGQNPFSLAACELDLINYHEYKFSQPYPEKLINKASRYGQYKIRQSRSYPQVKPTGPTIGDMIRQSYFQKRECSEKTKQLLYFLHSTFQYDPTTRAKPRELLAHPFLEDPIIETPAIQESMFDMDI